MSQIITLEAALERITILETALKEADKKAEAGLCCFEPGNMRGYLGDVRMEVAKVGLQGGLTEVKVSRGEAA